MKCTLFLLWIGFLFGTVICVEDERNKSTVDFIQSYGYPVETHYASTSDGFVLAIHRIPYGKGGKQANSKPVILQHGLLDTSATWVINPPSQSLGFILADNGFDVWLANARGNRYSMRNYYWDPSYPEFWNWNWDQHASIDIPAVIDLVREVTDSDTVSFVGHSQGATTAIAGFSTNVTLSKYVNVFIALAPVTYLYDQHSPLLTSLAALRADYILGLLGDKQFIPTPAILQSILGTVCQLTPTICNNVLGSLFGTSTKLNSSSINVYTAHWPDSTSIQNMIHWLKNTRDKDFENYNGVSYFPQNVGVPTAIYYGDKDYLADPQDVTMLIETIGNDTFYTQIVTGYTHMDFTWSYTASTAVYPSLVQVLKKYNP